MPEISQSEYDLWVKRGRISYGNAIIFTLLLWPYGYYRLGLGIKFWKLLFLIYFLAISPFIIGMIGMLFGVLFSALGVPWMGSLVWYTVRLGYSFGPLGTIIVLGYIIYNVHTTVKKYENMGGIIGVEEKSHSCIGEYDDELPECLDCDEGEACKKKTFPLG